MGNTEIAVDFVNDVVLGNSQLNILGGSVTVSRNYTSGVNSSVLIDGGELIYAHTNASPLIDAATYTVTSGKLTVSSNTDFTGSFAVPVDSLEVNNGATVNFNVQAAINNLTLDAGAMLGGSASVAINNNFDWVNGTVGGFYSLASGATSTITNGTLTTSFGLQDNSRIVNNGNLQLVGAGGINAVVQNFGDVGTGVFENKGTLVLVDSQGSFLMDSVFINTGIVDVADNSLNLNNIADEWNGGEFRGIIFGEVFIGGAITLNSSAKKTINGVNFIVSSDSLITVVGDGNIDITNNGRLSHQNFGQSVFGAKGPGSDLGLGLGLSIGIRHQSDGDIISSDGTGFFLNQGHFVNESGDTTISVDFKNEASSFLFDPNLEVMGGKLTIVGDYQQVDDFGFGLNVLVTGGELVYAQDNVSPLTELADIEISGGKFTVKSDMIFSTMLQNNGEFNVTNGAVVQLFSQDTGSGKININGGGVVELGGSGQSHGNVFDIAADGQLTIASGLHVFESGISGDGTLLIENAPSLGAGIDLLVDSTAGTLIMEGGIITGDGDLTLSQLSTWSGGDMEFGGGGITNFNGGVDITGAVGFDRTVNVTGGSLNNGEMFAFDQLSSEATGNTTGMSQAAFNIVGGTFVVLGDSSTQSAVTVESGALDIAGILTAEKGVSNTGGTLMGTGSIVGDVINGAMLNPGNSPGTLKIVGDLILLSSSVLNLEIASSDLFDQLIVSGNLEFGGELAIFVDTTTGFSGALNDEFVPFQFGSSSNSFALVSAKPEGFGFEFDGLNLILTNIPGLSALVPENDSLVFTNTLEAFIDPFVDVGNKDADEEDDKEKTLVCS